MCIQLHTCVVVYLVRHSVKSFITADKISVVLKAKSHTCCSGKTRKKKLLSQSHETDNRTDLDFRLLLPASPAVISAIIFLHCSDSHTFMVHRDVHSTLHTVQGTM